jgi:glucose-6-phosphate isomerase
LININAYNQPGVEAGKKASGNVLAIQREVIAHLKKNLNQALTVTELAQAIGRQEDVETIFKVTEHLAANTVRKIKKKSARSPFEARYKIV